MQKYYKEFLISDEKKLLQLDRIYDLLSTTYWAYNRDKEIISKSIENSLCFGVYKDDIQIGFSRCVTDYCVIFWLCDVIIDEHYRNLGIGTKMIECLLAHEKLENLRGILTANTEHRKFYEKFGFESKASFMFRPNNKTIIID